MSELDHECMFVVEEYIFSCPDISSNATLAGAFSANESAQRHRTALYKLLKVVQHFLWCITECPAVERQVGEFCCQS